MPTKYYLTDSEPPHPVRFVDDRIAEVMDTNGKWTVSNHRHAGRTTGEITEVSEGVALAAAQKLVNSSK